MNSSIFSQKSASIALYITLLLLMFNRSALSEGVNDYLRRGSELFNRGDFSGAEKQYRKALGEDNHHPVAQLGLSNALYEKGKPAEAKAQLTELIKEHPNFVAAYYLLGLLYEKEGNVDEAKKSYKLYAQKAQGNIPPDPAVRIKLRKFGVL